MKACTFLPAAMHIVYELGLEDHLYGVTFECPSNRPKVVRSVLEGQDLTSDEIEEVVTAFAREGKSLYYIDIDLLRKMHPDVIFTQHVCEVCQVDTSIVEEALGTLEHRPEVVPLVPRRLEDIYVILLPSPRRSIGGTGEWSWSTRSGSEQMLLHAACRAELLKSAA